MKTKQKQRLLLGSLVLILVISSFTYLPVVADDDDDDGVDDDVEEENKRDISINYDGDDAKIESKVDSGDNKNRFMALMEGTSEGLKFDLEFEKVTVDNQTVIKFWLNIPEIIEFEDTNANGIYEPSVDTVASTYLINSYKTLVHTTQTIKNETVYIFSLETTDGIFNTTMYVSGGFVEVNDILIAPSQFKFDIIISGFNYTANDTLLALKIELDSEFDVEFEEDEKTEDEADGRASDEQQVEVGYGNYTAYFSWLKTATVDGVEQDVLASSVTANLEDSEMYLNYPQGTEIIHDPKIGIEGLITGWGGLGTVGIIVIVSAVSFFAIIGLVLVIRRK
jgi:hypothetical protein